MPELIPYSPEAVATPEREAIAGLDALARRVFAQYPAHTAEDSTAETIWQLQSGAKFQRTTAEDGAVSYELATLWHADTDRGAFVSKWNEGGDELVTFSKSEMEGPSPENLADSARIQQISEQLDTLFPAKVEQEQRTTLRKRMLGRIAAYFSGE